MATPRAQSDSIQAEYQPVSCDQCGGSGLEPVFEHVSFPVHAPVQKHVEVEPYDFAHAERKWEEGIMVYQLLESFRVCSCPAGQRRAGAMKERQQETGRRRGWRPNGAKSREAVQQ